MQVYFVCSLIVLGIFALGFLTGVVWTLKTAYRG